MIFNKRGGLIIFGSPHFDGFTAKALNKFIQRFEYTVDFSFVDAYKKNAHPCIDCGFCKSIDGCVFDDLKDFDVMLRDADIIVFATPIYNVSVPSPMKAIFDRMQRYYCSRFFQDKKLFCQKKKEGALIVTCGSDDEFGINVIQKQVGRICSIINCEITYQDFVKKTDF